nr:sigma-70 family RNA polymerase sigma factor [Prevotella sp.]
MGIKKSEEKERAFQELFQENYSRLFYASFYIINNESDARDIVHDYFADLWEDFSPVTQSYTKAYLYNGVRRKSLDYLKHQMVKNKYAKLYLALHEDVNSDYDEEEDRMVKVEQVMSEMPARTRFIFDQCYFENKKYEEVAEILGLSRDGIRKNIIKGLAMLRAAFDVSYKKGRKV